MIIFQKSKQERSSMPICNIKIIHTHTHFLLAEFQKYLMASSACKYVLHTREEDTEKSCQVFVPALQC